MLISAPVYSMQNDTHFVNIYSEQEDGTFKRTQDEPLRLLRDDIAGISMTQGEMISSHYDRADRSWNTATVSYHYGHPQSFYQFLRDNVARKRFFVFSLPVMSGHLYKFTVHELKLKNSMSQRKISLLKEKYVEAIGLWSKDEYNEYLQKAQAVSTDVSTASRAVEKVDFRVFGRGAKENPALTEALNVVATEASSGKDKHPGARPVSGIASSEKLATRSLMDNPFASKSSPSRLHFLRRFIFHRS